LEVAIFRGLRQLLETRLRARRRIGWHDERNARPARNVQTRAIGGWIFKNLRRQISPVHGLSQRGKICPARTLFSAHRSGSGVLAPVVENVGNVLDRSCPLGGAEREIIIL